MRPGDLIPEDSLEDVTRFLTENRGVYTFTWKGEMFRMPYLGGEILGRRAYPNPLFRDYIRWMDATRLLSKAELDLAARGATSIDTEVALENLRSIGNRTFQTFFDFYRNPSSNPALRGVLKQGVQFRVPDSLQATLAGAHISRSSYTTLRELARTKIAAEYGPEFAGVADTAEVMRISLREAKRLGGIRTGELVSWGKAPATLGVTGRLAIVDVMEQWRDTMRVGIITPTLTHSADLDADVAQIIRNMKPGGDPLMLSRLRDAPAVFQRIKKSFVSEKSAFLDEIMANTEPSKNLARTVQSMRGALKRVSEAQTMEQYLGATLWGDRSYSSYKLTRYMGELMRRKAQRIKLWQGEIVAPVSPAEAIAGYEKSFESGLPGMFSQAQNVGRISKLLGRQTAARFGRTGTPPITLQVDEALRETMIKMIKGGAKEFDVIETLRTGDTSIYPGGRQGFLDRVYGAIKPEFSIDRQAFDQEMNLKLDFAQRSGGVFPATAEDMFEPVGEGLAKARVYDKDATVVQSKITDLFAAQEKHGAFRELQQPGPRASSVDYSRAKPMFDQNEIDDFLRRVSYDEEHELLAKQMLQNVRYDAKTNSILMREGTLTPIHNNVSILAHDLEIRPFTTQSLVKQFLGQNPSFDALEDFVERPVEQLSLFASKTEQDLLGTFLAEDFAYEMADHETQRLSVRMAFLESNNRPQLATVFDVGLGSVTNWTKRMRDEGLFLWHGSPNKIGKVSFEILGMTEEFAKRLELAGMDRGTIGVPVFQDTEAFGRYVGSFRFAHMQPERFLDYQSWNSIGFSFEGLDKTGMMGYRSKLDPISGRNITSIRMMPVDEFTMIPTQSGEIAIGRGQVAMSHSMAEVLKLSDVELNLLKLTDGDETLARAIAQELHDARSQVLAGDPMSLDQAIMTIKQRIADAAPVRAGRAARFGEIWETRVAPEIAPYVRSLSDWNVNLDALTIRAPRTFGDYMKLVFGKAKHNVQIVEDELLEKMGLPLDAVFVGDQDWLSKTDITYDAIANEFYYRNPGLSRTEAYNMANEVVAGKRTFNWNKKSWFLSDLGLTELLGSHKNVPVNWELMSIDPAYRELVMTNMEAVENNPAMAVRQYIKEMMGDLDAQSWVAQEFGFGADWSLNGLVLDKDAAERVRRLRGGRHAFHVRTPRDIRAVLELARGVDEVGLFGTLAVEDVQAELNRLGKSGVSYNRVRTDRLLVGLNALYKDKFAIQDPVFTQMTRQLAREGQEIVPSALSNPSDPGFNPIERILTAINRNRSLKSVGTIQMSYDKLLDRLMPQGSSVRAAMSRAKVVDVISMVGGKKAREWAEKTTTSGLVSELFEHYDVGRLVNRTNLLIAGGILAAAALAGQFNKHRFQMDMHRIEKQVNYGRGFNRQPTIAIYTRPRPEVDYGVEAQYQSPSLSVDVNHDTDENLDLDVERERKLLDRGRLR